MNNTQKEIQASPSLSMDNIRSAYSMDENECVDLLLTNSPFSEKDHKDILTTAGDFVQNVRANRKKFGGIDSFLQEFGLSTQEGVALMCLSEALLRIPDSDTADKLIKDKIGSAHWEKHVGQGSDLFVNASTWALMLTGKVVGDANEKKEKAPTNILNSLVAKMGEPIIRKAILHTMKILGKQFVTGRNIDEALKNARDFEKMGYRYSYDMLGEGARTADDANTYFESYQTAIDAIGKSVQNRKLDHYEPCDVPGISIKLSAIHPRYHYELQDKCVPELTEKLKSLALQCAKYNIGLTVDAEEVNRLGISLDIIENVFTDPDLKDWSGFGLAIQAYQKRAPFVIDWLAELIKGSDRKMMIRLVKGAYWDSEIKDAQVNGLNEYPVFTRKASTDISYLNCAAKLMEQRDLFYPQFATHNAHTVAAILHLAKDDLSGFEFQRLHGMGEPLYHQIIGTKDDEGKFPVRVYAPVGCHEDLLPYLVRRLLENGANSSFVNRIQDDRISIDDIISNPYAYVQNLDDKRHPKIPLPIDLYGDERPNSKGVDFADENASSPLLKEINEHFQNSEWTAEPSHLSSSHSLAEKEPVINPANTEEIVGYVTKADADDMEQALKDTYNAFPDWSKTPATERAQCLIKMAELMEENKAELMAICIKEAGKTIPDALSEIREAIDFCYYYAAQGVKNFAKPVTLNGPTGELNQISLHGRGVFLCISPWNFPLAIFLGQVTAALMAGNTVISKPATQTPLIAARAVELLYEAGIPRDALALLPMSGRLTGKILVPNPKIAGIVFTGSTDTAQQIQLTLAQRNGAIIPFIAETGGQNVMIVDNSALAEQIVDDIIVSAFQSAGQRCSALRVLYIQDGIADKVIKMLDGAVQELIIGNPACLRTDIGPVIDKAALDNLEQHKQAMSKSANTLTYLRHFKHRPQATFCLPAAYQIGDINELEQENFGPILHVIRYNGKELDKVIQSINDTGYGLTLGIHTRIDHIRDYIIDNTHVGNSYVNRSMIGAVVGVQPFGGQGLSGTGPKAGGPHYLLRFATEKTLTINTTASGGNTTLISLSEND